MRARRRLLDAQFRQAGFDGAGHAAELFDFADVTEGPCGKVAGQPFDKERAAPGIDDAGGAAFLLQHDLGVARDPRGKIRRQRQRLIERIGVQRLRAALRGGHGLDASARHIIEHILRSQRPARGLAMGAQRQRARILRLELFH